MSVATDIENAFLTSCAAVSGVASTIAKEGPTNDKLPAVALFFYGCPQVPDATSGYDLVDWLWGVEISVRLDDLVNAQTELQTILPGIMKIVRTDPSLGGKCEWATLEDREEPPFRSTDNLSFVKRIYLRAQTVEHG